MQAAPVLPLPSPAPAPFVPPRSPTKVALPKSTREKPSSKPTKVDTSASPAGPAAIVLFGPDANGRPHGARFVGSEATMVERAADLMDLYCYPADTEALRELAAKLPAGRLFPVSGKALVPFTSAALYDRLCAATGTPATPRPVKAAAKPAEAGGGTGGGQGRGTSGSGAGDPPASRIGAKAPADHGQIGLGSRVLAEDEDEGGYYPATVVATKADDHFVLRWSGFDLPEFARPRRALALLHPEAAEAAE